jgi:flagellar basal-body rod protein FlgG
MKSALWVAKTGLDALQTKMAGISNNLANVNTTGVKRDRAVFEDLLYQNVRQTGGNTTEETSLPSGLQVGTGVRVVSTEKLHTQGNIVTSENALDLAISGRGYFQILQPDGTTAYTRDGSFSVDANGQMVTASGYTLQPGIAIPAGAQSITIGSDGTVSVQIQGTAAPSIVGSIQLADFVNPVGLQAMGENLYQETAASGAAVAGTPGLNGVGKVMQGSLETSNVNVVEEMVNMIETQRAYEMNSKAISASDQMLQFLNNNV